MAYAMSASTLATRQMQLFKNICLVCAVICVADIEYWLSLLRDDAVGRGGGIGI
jgi:hypothetical protein